MSHLRSVNIFFLFCLLVFSALFYLERHFMFTFDETDPLASLYLFSRDFKLYSQINTSHFPFPYFWISLFSPLSLAANFSRAIAFFRLSLLPLYLIVFVLVYIFSTRNSTRFLFSLFILLLSLFFSLYHGNVLLGETFLTIFLIGLFWLIIPHILRWESMTLPKLLLIILFAALAFWTQPLAIFLLPLPFLFSPKTQLKVLIPLTVALLLIPPIYLFLHGQLSEFYRSTIWFNLTIYSQEFPEKIGSYSMTTQNIRNFFEHEFFYFTHFFAPLQIFQFFVHLSAIVLFIFVAKLKNPKHIAAFFLLFLVTRLREIKIVPGTLFNYGSYPFLALSASSALFLPSLFRYRSRFLYILIILALYLTALSDSWPILQQSLHPGYNYMVFWSYRQQAGELISTFSLPQEPVLSYPHDPDLYYFSHRLPPDRFIYWYPWLDLLPAFKQERLTALKSNPPSVIYLGDLAYRNHPLRYSEFFPELLSNYRLIYHQGQSTHLYLRSDLSSRVANPYSFTPPKTNSLSN